MFLLYVPARDDTSSEVVISISLFKVHFVRHSGVSLCLCVVSLSWIHDDWSSAFVLLGHFLSLCPQRLLWRSVHSLSPCVPSRSALRLCGCSPCPVSGLYA